MADIEFIATGFGTVITVLALLWLVCWVIGWFHKDRIQPVSTVEESAEFATVPVPSAHLAAISAAIAEIVPARHRIVRVYAPGHTSSNWIEGGRFELSTSHRVHSGWAASGLTDPSRKKTSQNRENLS